jgi:hypothetical protein
MAILIFVPLTSTQNIITLPKCQFQEVEKKKYQAEKRPKQQVLRQYIHDPCAYIASFVALV